MGDCEKCRELERENEDLHRALRQHSSAGEAGCHHGDNAGRHSDENCTVSVAFDRQYLKDKYQSAVQTFLQRICSTYEGQVKTDYISSPQPCKFLLWVTFVGNGRLPEDMQRFNKYADLAENALIVIVKYINNETEVPAIVSGVSGLASGLHLRTENESKHILQLIVSGEIDGPKEYSWSSSINSANQQLLEQLLQRVYMLKKARSGHAQERLAQGSMVMETHRQGAWAWFCAKCNWRTPRQPYL